MFYVYHHWVLFSMQSLVIFVYSRQLLGANSLHSVLPNSFLNTLVDIGASSIGLHFFPCWTDHVGVCFPVEEPRTFQRELCCCCISFQPKLVLHHTQIVQIWCHFGELHYVWLVNARLGLGLDPDVDGELCCCCISSWVFKAIFGSSSWHQFFETRWFRKMTSYSLPIW